MRVRIELPLSCSADKAWAAMHTPSVAADLYQPLLVMEPIRDALPERFASGARVRVAMRLFRRFPVGSQLIAIDDVEPFRMPANARTMRDSGRPLAGPLSLLSVWHHEITVWPTGVDRATWHDELTIRGAFAPVFWPVLWVMWKWRGQKLQRLAGRW